MREFALRHRSGPSTAPFRHGEAHSPPRPNPQTRPFSCNAIQCSETAPETCATKRDVASRAAISETARQSRSRSKVNDKKRTIRSEGFNNKTSKKKIHRIGESELAIIVAAGSELASSMPVLHARLNNHSVLSCSQVVGGTVKWIPALTCTTKTPTLSAIDPTYMLRTWP